MAAVTFIVVIPARLGSTRLPNKPLADIGGKPMVVHTAQRALQSSAERVLVATDSTRIVDICQSYGLQTVLTSPDHPTGTDRICQVANLLQLPDQAIVVNVQGDEPLVPPTIIDSVAVHLHHHPDCVIATAAHPLTNVEDVFNPNLVKVVLDKYDRALIFSRAPLPWARDLWGPDVLAKPTGQRALPSMPILHHIGIYAYRAKFLKEFAQYSMCPLEETEKLEQLRAMWHGEKIAVLKVDQAPAGAVDTPADLERIRAVWEEMNQGENGVPS